MVNAIPWKLACAFSAFLEILLLAATPTSVQELGVSNRTDQIARLQAAARARADRDRLIYSEADMLEIEARYRSAHDATFPQLILPEGRHILLEIVTRYPRSNRAGCALVELAQLAAGRTREKYLKQAIVEHPDAWFESGVQVAALAQARLAIHYAGLGRLDEAERLAADLSHRFPLAIDPSGAPLSDVVKGVTLLRAKK